METQLVISILGYKLLSAAVPGNLKLFLIQSSFILQLLVFESFEEHNISPGSLKFE